MLKNNERFDLSPHLIHFFRTIDLEKAEVASPENWGPHAIVEDTLLSPMFMLRNAIRLRRIWATWSLRGGRRTVYGPNPAVCFTEMPIAAFIEAGEARSSKGEAMSSFALVLPKDHLHARGALPVIYGVANDAPLPKGKGGEERIMPSSVLPESEQFRYVAFGKYGRIDWTHEREWRWPFRGGLTDYEGLPPSTGEEMPGLELNFPGMGVIVRTKDQADRIIHDALVLHDLGAAGDYEFVLVTDDVPDLSKLRDPKDVRKAITSASIDLSDIVNLDKASRKKAMGGYRQALADISRKRLPTYGREMGKCWLWLTDVAHPITRALLSKGMVHINKDGRYLVDPDFENRPLSQHEELTRRLAELLAQRHGLSASYHSVLGSAAPDGIPSYSDPPLQSRNLFNYGNDMDDC